MPFVLSCTIKAGALGALKALRGRHLAYIEAHREAILFGGPARGADGAPEEMIIVLKTDDRTAAKSFIAAEPYTASGLVFATVQVRPWSQVVPDAVPGALSAAIAAERATHPEQSP